MLNPQQIVKNRVTSYYRNKERKVFVNTWRQVEFGPLYDDIGTTIEDFSKYDQAIVSNRLLKKETYELMWSPFVLNNGRTVSNLSDEQQVFYADASYGYAWAIRTCTNHRIVHHGGYTGTSIFKLPDDSLTVILFTNLTDRAGFNPDIMAGHIASFYIAGCSYIYSAIKPDPYPAITRFVKEQITKMSTGTIDRTMFTIDFAEALAPALPGFAKRIQESGSLLTFEYLDGETSRDRKIKLFYKATYTNGILFYKISVTKENKIDFISVEK